MKESWENPITTGIFTQIRQQGLEWVTLENETALNLLYHVNRSGDKIISPLIENFTDNETALEANDKALIAQSAVALFSDKWEKLYSLLSLEFNPISNYDMTETENIGVETSSNTTHTGTEATAATGTNQVQHTGTETDINTGTETTQHTGTSGKNILESTEGDSDGATDNKIFGFNSSTGVNDSSNTNQIHAENSKTASETTTNNLTDTRTDNLNHQRTDNLTDLETRNTTDTTTRNLTDAETGETETVRELTRSGNIGVTTSQQMIQSSIDLWQWNFYNQVFEDLDTLLTISTY